MKIFLILCVLMMGCANPAIAAEDFSLSLESNPLRTDNAAALASQNSPSVDMADWIQEIRYELVPVDRYQVSALHLRPVYLHDHLRIQFDFGFYRNPGNQSWQWGKYDASITPNIPNIVDNAEYQGSFFEIDYHVISELKFGYGLLMDDYYPSTPYHGIELRIQPSAGTELTIIEPAEILSVQPYWLDPEASLEMVRWQNEVNFLGPGWHFGLTGLRENDGSLSGQFPVQAVSMDLTYQRETGCRPFVEAARLVDYGDGLMAGITGRFVSLDYQAGVFRTQGSFLPNYFGGSYEDRKRNTVRGGADPLPDLRTGNYGIRDGYLGRLSLSVANFINFNLLYINDPVISGGTWGINLSGRLNPWRMSYGIAYYGQGGGMPYWQWYINGSRGVYDYGYRHYVEQQTERDAFMIGIRL